MELPLTPLDFLARARRLFADRVAVIDGDRHFTYAELGERCDRQAQLLRDELRVQPGDVVAWLCGNTHELFEAYYGVLLAGAVLLPINIRLSPAEMRHVLDDSGAVVLFRHPDQVDPGHPVPTVLVDDGFDARLAAQRSGPLEPPVVDERSAAEIFYTSGSTGMPKGAVLTHRALYLHGVHSGLTSSVTGDDVVLHTIPLFHVNGWGTPHFLTVVGGQHVMLPRFDAAEVLRLVEAHRVTRLFGVPAMIRMLLDELARGGDRDVSSVQQVLIGGAPPGPELMAEAEARFGCPCLCGYGMTETAPSVTRTIDKPGEPSSPERRATTGLPLIGVDARVLLDDGREVAWDGETVGEICVRSNHVMEGYLNDPEATAAVIVDGWLHTGDLAVVRPDGYLQIVDRKKDLIISGGENIATPEVEFALCAHPAVREASVIGVPHPRWGEVPKAFVSLHADATATSAQLIEFVRGRLAHFKAPSEVVILDELPKGGTGKIQKQVLRGLGVAGAAEPVAQPAGEAVR